MMGTSQQSTFDGSGSVGPEITPLLYDDPPRVGDFWLDARLGSNEAGVAFLGHSDESPEVMVLVLSAGASQDPAARDRFAGEINKLYDETVVARGGQGQNGGRLAAKFRDEADDPVTPESPPIAPWAALAYDGSLNAAAEARRLLEAVDLSTAPPLGDPKGPTFQMHWTKDTSPGVWRLWPMSWPGRHDRAGWVPIFVSWLLMIFLAGLALLIAVLLFQNAPAYSPPPPVPTEASGGTGEESASASAEPSPPSDSPSMEESGEGTASSTAPPETVNTKL